MSNPKQKKRKPMELVINEKVIEIMSDPQTLHYLAARLIRRRPKYMPWWMWKAFLWVVLAPPAKEPFKPEASSYKQHAERTTP